MEQEMQVEVPFEMTLENVYAGLLAVTVILSYIVPNFDDTFAKLVSSLAVAIKEGELGQAGTAN